ncbi:MAG: chromosome segregation protein SMC [Candidatus Borkfalkiaceae bacterium]|nr:chromosome segregation protein SMC [Christensenellaceae bacterium]
MDLKEIRLSGFKSFADKTVIRFDEGVTCIVGPNGCGKSNVADAVRWVLGEQSPKALRGGNMQDVIFGGTQSRKPQSSCEVTLVFDNTNKIFDLDVAEVAMTRRLDRNGNSGYFINGQPSRLKDIVRLFHGIGLGKEGYSIIGQGKVEQIMNAKPEDRRLIFEEATGLMVYKSRKEEIERKIDSSKNNLYIYAQRIEEAERRLGPLSKQADAAKEYKEYSDSLKFNEVNTYVCRYDSAEDEKNKFRERVAGYSDKIISLNTQSELLNKSYEDTRRKAAEADQKLTDLNDRRVELSVGNERKDGEWKLVREKISTYKSQITAAGEFLENGKTRTGELADAVAAAKEAIKKGETRIAEIDNETDLLSQAIKALSGKIEVFEKLSDENRQSQLSSAENLSEIRKNQGSLAAQMQAAEDRIAELTAALKKEKARKEKLEEELDGVRKDLKKLKEFTSGGEKELADREEEIRDMQLTINNFNQELFSVGGQISSLKDSLEMYIGIKNRYEGYKDSVRRLLSVAKTNPEVGSHVKGTIADIIHTDQKYELAFEVALGAATQNVVTPTQDDARILIEYLKRTGGGVVTFLPVTGMKPRPDSREAQRATSEKGAIGLATDLIRYDEYYYNVVTNLLGNTLICDTVYNATAIAKKYGNTFRIVTLDGDIVSTSGAMTGGSRQQKGASVLAGERKIEECRENILKKQKYLEKLKIAIAESEKGKEEAEAAVNALRAKYQGSLNELAVLSQREISLTKESEEAQSNIDVYAETLKGFEEKLGRLKDEEAYAGKSEEELNAMRQGAEATLEKQRGQCEAFKAERDEKSAKLHALEVEKAAAEKQIESLNADIRRYEKEKEDLIARIISTEREKATAEAELSALEEKAKQAELTEEEKAAVQAVNDEIATVSAEKEALNIRQVQLDEERTAVQEELTKQTDKRYKCEIEISKIDTNLENMRQRIEEAYGIDYEGCLALKADNFNVDEAAGLISALKRKITLLGNVNLNAVEEYADEKAHYDEMTVQRDDLQKAIDDLQQALDEIRAEMLKIFDAGFNDINENFKVTFKELFGGGNAELQMDYIEGQDPLEAGVEIVACPPGKKLTKISLLSGGERALTAIAILFAILKCRPMPFCILDEIEAALDEANVDRFASYLKHFSQETQFIVITHRRPTMNQSDALFGVTMQEKGVSKIVSVKLGEVEKQLGEGTVE